MREVKQVISKPKEQRRELRIEARLRLIDRAGNNPFRCNETEKLISRCICSACQEEMVHGNGKTRDRHHKIPEG